MSAEEGSKNKETGLKKFLLDPKSGVNSVRTFISENANNTHQTNANQNKTSLTATQNWNQHQYSNDSGHLGPNMNPTLVPINQQFGTSRPSSSASHQPDPTQQPQQKLTQQLQAPQQNINQQQPAYQAYHQPDQQNQQAQPQSQQQSQNQQQQNVPYSLTANILDFLGQSQHPETNQPTSPPTTNGNFANPTPVRPANQYLSNVQQEAPYPATVMYPVESQAAHHFAGASLGSQLDINRSMYNSSPGHGLAPPPAETAAGVATAPRLYHRMILEFETLKSIFYAARVQPYHNNLIPVVAKLKALAREIWNLRYTRTSEFDYAEAAHQPIIIFWKEQFEQWSDTLEDMHDPILMQRLALVDQENNYPAMAGLGIAGIQTPGPLPTQQAPSAGAPVAAPTASTTPSPALDTPAATPVKKAAVKKTVTPATPAADGDAPVVKKKVVKKATPVDGEAAPVVKKKVVKKKVAAAE